MGITRADLRIPISNFGFYKGVSGYFLSCIEYEGKLYVGSSEGLYYLDEERDYRAIDIELKRRKEKSNISSENQKNIKQDEKSEQSVEQKKRRFISRLFSRKSDDKKDEEQLASDQSQSKTLSHEKELPTIKRRIYELQSISHSYKKVEGIQGKVRQLMVHKSKLYAATNFGLYELESNRARLVVRNKNIVFMQESFFQKDLILLGTDEGAYYAHKQGNRWNVVTLFEEQNPLVVSILDIDELNFIVTTEFDVFLISKNSKSGFDSKQIYLPGTDLNIPVIRIVNNKVMAFTSEGLYNFNAESIDFKANSTFILSSNFSMLFNQRDYTWVKEGREWILLSSFEDNKHFATSFLRLLDNPNYINIANDTTIYVVNAFSQLYRMSVGKAEKEEKPVSVFIKNISGINGRILNPQSINLEYSNNSLRINISAPSYLKEGSVQFQYIISGLMEDWSEWFNNPNIDFPFFAPGDYVISIRAKDILGNFSEEVSVPIKINPPFWQTFWFFAVCFILLLFIFILIVKVRERTLRKEKEVLEQKVKERTKTIEEQNKVLTIQRDDLAKYNKEILMQKEEIESQRDEIEKQRDHIFKQNEEITQSITYARKIQSAVMPSNEVVGKLLSDYFILFRPRDIVSGDFYWMTERNNRVVVVAGDCTGHGVPGAFMSMMGVSFLNEIVNVDGQTQPDIILNSLREKIISTLYQMGKDGETRDGMDMSIIVFLRNTRTLMFAGAYNPLYLIRKGELIEHKADKMPVGVHPKEKVPFTLHNIKLEAGDNLYIFSDGYVSQFGGPDGRKFMAKPFKELLVKIYGKSIQDQKTILEDTMDKWQNAYDQVDDILVIGIAVK
jgi:serine phosphatase RsbU (regulator of sigma subunit)